MADFYNADELQALIDEASQIFEDVTKSEMDLRKSDDDSKDKEDSSGDSGGSADASGSADAGGPPPAADDAGSSAPADAPPAAGAADAGGSAVAAADPGAAAVAGPVDPAALQAGYAQMPPDELMAHLQAAQAAAQALGLGAAGAGGPPGAPPGASPGAPPPDASAGAMPPPAPPVAPAGAASASSPAGPPAPPFGKGELGAGAKVADAAGNEKANGGSSADAFKVKEGESFGKSEKTVAEITALEKRLSEMEEQNALLEKAVELLAVPAQRAITGRDVAFLAKTEEKPNVALPANREEAMGKLREIARRTDLTKNERDLISDYSFGRVSIEKLEGLFGKK